MTSVAGRTRLTIPMITRAEHLREVGLSYADVAAVLELDTGLPVTGRQVCYHLQHLPRKPATNDALARYREASCGS